MEYITVIDNEGILLYKTILSAAESFNVEALAQDIVRYNISDGLNIYNRLEGGIFEKTSIPRGNKEELAFYIYSVEYPV